MRIFLDMDDTLTNFQQAFIDITDMEPLKFKDVMTSQFREMGMDNKEAAKMFVFAFWVTIHMQPFFWEKMSPMKGFKKLWRFVKKYHPIVLTAVCELPQFKNLSIAGKRAWVTKHMSADTHMLTIDLNSYDHTKMDKTIYCEGPQDILIDDNKHNVEAWIAKGGNAIHYKDAKSTIKELKKIIKEIKVRSHK